MDIKSIRFNAYVKKWDATYPICEMEWDKFGNKIIEIIIYAPDRDKLHHFYSFKINEVDIHLEDKC